MSDADQEGDSRDLLEDPPGVDELFPFESPYSHQRDGIELVTNTAESGGFVVIEGGCGTGKTLIGLDAAAKLIRDPSTKYKRAFILTSVKQQLRQFENDLRELNRNLPDDIRPLDGLSLQGKVDVCSYQVEGRAGFTRENCHRRCQSLRSKTASMAHGKSHRFRELASSASKVAEDGRAESLAVHGSETPYPTRLPTNNGTEYCPFYARIQSMEGDVPFRFSRAPGNVLDTTTLTEMASKEGVCPHTAMTSLVSEAEVIMANYYHAFERNTLQLTLHAIDDQTLVIADEAHMLVPKVRDIFSTNVSLATLEYSLQEIAQLLAGLGTPSETSPVVDQSASQFYAEIEDRSEGMNPLGKNTVEEQLVDEGLIRDHLEFAYCFVRDFVEGVRSSVPNLMDSQKQGWRSNLYSLPDTIELPLRNPSEPGTDGITKWMEGAGYPDDAWEQAARVLDGMAEISRALNSDGDPALVDTAEICYEWGERDNTDYFREIILEDSDRSRGEGWRSRYRAIASVRNCMPRAGICSRLGSFGGGLLMSATLEPLDAYQDLTGLEYLRDFEGRKVTCETYQSDFPESNRASYIVPLKRFTHSNRSGNSRLRERYLSAMLAINRTPGNVLVCMPSYAEARWAAEALDERLDRNVLLDRSSSEGETQALKEEFFDGGPKTMVTSLRGTLIEGVDYDGDKLRAVAVCGLPLANVSSPHIEAIQTAYKEQYGERTGYQYSMVVPAVRKTRQAIGRVIRSAEDVGIRAIIDERYAESKGYTAAGKYLGPEGDEFETVPLNELPSRVDSFWSRIG